MTDEEAIFAYTDGELQGEEHARIEAIIDADPALRAMVAEHRALAGRLQGAFSTIVEAPIPAPLSLSVRARAEVVSLAAAPTRRQQRPAVWNSSHWMAMAATLVAGVIGGAVLSDGRQGPVVEQGGHLVASGSLERALSTQLASAQGDKPPIRIGMTFRNHEGEICRSFAAKAAEGVACREKQAWQMQGLLAHENGRTGDYRMASSSGTAELVDRLITGDALDQAQEGAALAADWPSSRAP